MTRFLHALGLALVAALALALPSTAGADAANPPPMGEILNGTANSPPFSSTITCPTPNNGRLEYTISGIALGPYPGTFTESGTIEIGGGTVTSFSAQFTIVSGDTTIQGTKGGPISFRGVATCAENHPDLPPGGNFLHAGPFDARYEATITSPAGTTTYSGPAANDFDFLSGSISSGSSQEILTAAEPGPGPGEPATVLVTPTTAVNQVGTSHTVTADVQTASGSPSAGVAVLFTVSGAVNTSGSCTTDANGQCSFTYQGPLAPGADAIQACADSNGNGTADPGEPCGAASKVWTLPASTPGQVTGGGYLPDATLAGLVSFGFNAQSSGGGVKGNCNVIDHGTGQHLKCLDVTTLVQTPTHATFFGEATVDGVATNYRIDVDDLGEPGVWRDTFKIQTDGGFAAAGVLTGGNIQIHP